MWTEGSLCSTVSGQTCQNKQDRHIQLDHGLWKDRQPGNKYSGAAMSLIPAKFMTTQVVRGTVGEPSLQTAVEENEDMRVLVTTEDTILLLGTDHPHFTKKRAKRKHDSSPPPQQTHQP